MLKFPMTCTKCTAPATHSFVDLVEKQTKKKLKYFKPYGEPKAGCGNHLVTARIYYLGVGDYPKDV